jgi:hypothetical protein
VEAPESTTQSGEVGAGDNGMEPNKVSRKACSQPPANRDRGAKAGFPKAGR